MLCYYYLPHRVYNDAMPGIVETEDISCPQCLSYESDEMWVKVVREEIGAASRRTIIRHLVLIETHHEPVVHFTVCYHDLRRRGLECCFVGFGPTLNNKPLSLEEFITRERSQDQADRSGDELPKVAGYISFLQTITQEDKGLAR